MTTVTTETPSEVTKSSGYTFFDYLVHFIVTFLVESLPYHQTSRYLLGGAEKLCAGPVLSLST